MGSFPCPGCIFNLGKLSSLHLPLGWKHQTCSNAPWLKPGSWTCPLPMGWSKEPSWSPLALYRSECSSCCHLQQRLCCMWATDEVYWWVCFHQNQPKESYGKKVEWKDSDWSPSGDARDRDVDSALSGCRVHLSARVQMALSNLTLQVRPLWIILVKDWTVSRYLISGNTMSTSVLAQYQEKWRAPHFCSHPFPSSLPSDSKERIIIPTKSPIAFKFIFRWIASLLPMAELGTCLWGFFTQICSFSCSVLILVSWILCHRIFFQRFLCLFSSISQQTLEMLWQFR